MSSQQSPLWPAKSHTIAKITILKQYLLAWFQILGRSMGGRELIYIDGFAGPGEYTNYSEGSPLAAISAAITARSQSAAVWRAGAVHCGFIEADQDNFDNLLKKISPYQRRTDLKLYPIKAPFVDGMTLLQSQMPSLNSDNPRFIFIDPFGATGAPFSLVADILAYQSSEVLINVDADGIARNVRANNTSTLDLIFGDNSWHSILAISSFQDQCRSVLELYRQRLRSLPNISYTFPFEMRSGAGTLDYFLVFASQHPLGLEKMKEAMQTIDDSGAYRFSDAYSNQGPLFRFDHPEDYTDQLFQAFRGQTAPYATVRDYALNETPFTNPKGLLKLLEERLDVTVQGVSPTRRRGTFPDDQLDKMIIRFHQARAPQAQRLFP